MPKKAIGKAHHYGSAILMTSTLLPQDGFLFCVVAKRVSNGSWHYRSFEIASLLFANHAFFGCRINIFEQWQWPVISSSFLSLITRCAPCAAAALFSAPPPQITHTNMCGRRAIKQNHLSIHPFDRRSSALPKVAPNAVIDRLGAFGSEKQCGSRLGSRGK